MRTGLPAALRRWALRLGLAAVMAIGLAYVPYRMLDPEGARRVADLQEKLDQTRARQAALRSENAHFRSEISALRSDPKFVEDVARQELGMVAADETIYQVRSLPRPPVAAEASP